MNVASKKQNDFIPKFTAIDKISTIFMGCTLGLLFLIDMILNLNNISPFDLESLLGSVLIFISGYYYYNFKSSIYRWILLTSGTTMIILAQFYAHIFDFNSSLFFEKFLVVIFPIIISSVIYFINIPKLLHYQKNRN